MLVKLCFGTSGDLQGPSTALGTLRIFPLWLYALLEEMKVRADRQPAGRLDIIEQTA